MGLTPLPSTKLAVRGGLPPSRRRICAYLEVQRHFDRRGRAKGGKVKPEHRPNEREHGRRVSAIHRSRTWPCARSRGRWSVLGGPAFGGGIGRHRAVLTGSAADLAGADDRSAIFAGRRGLEEESLPARCRPAGECPARYGRLRPWRCQGPALRRQELPAAGRILPACRRYLHTL